MAASCDSREVKVVGELCLHLLEDWVLRGGLRAACQRLAGGARERLGNARYVLDACESRGEKEAGSRGVTCHVTS